MDWNTHRFAVDDEARGALEVEDADGVLLRDLDLPAGSRFLYTYDFGDSWEHLVEVEKYLRANKTATYPRCTKAVRAGPPEDCGGLHGYARLLRIVANPRHAEHEDALEWLGDDFDPRRVSADDITADLVAVIGGA